jgi:hypothetical protein
MLAKKGALRLFPTGASTHAAFGIYEAEATVLTPTVLVNLS